MVDKPPTDQNGLLDEPDSGGSAQDDPFRDKANTGRAIGIVLLARGGDITSRDFDPRPVYRGKPCSSSLGLAGRMTFVRVWTRRWLLMRSCVTEAIFVSAWTRHLMPTGCALQPRLRRGRC